MGGSGGGGTWVSLDFEVRESVLGRSDGGEFQTKTVERKAERFALHGAETVGFGQRSGTTVFLLEL